METTSKKKKSDVEEPNPNVCTICGTKFRKEFFKCPKCGSTKVKIGG